MYQHPSPHPDLHEHTTEYTREIYHATIKLMQLRFTHAYKFGLINHKIHSANPN